MEGRIIDRKDRLKEGSKEGREDRLNKQGLKKGRTSQLIAGRIGQSVAGRLSQSIAERISWAKEGSKARDVILNPVFYITAEVHTYIRRLFSHLKLAFLRGLAGYIMSSLSWLQVSPLPWSPTSATQRWNLSPDKHRQHLTVPQFTVFNEGACMWMMEHVVLRRIIRWLLMMMWEYT